MFIQDNLAQLSGQTLNNINTYSYTSDDNLADVLATGYFANATQQYSEYGWANSIIFAELGDGFFTLQVGSTQVTATAVASLPTATASYQATPADPTGTTDNTGKMMGLAGAITPTVTGNILIVISGSGLSGTNGDGVKTQIRTGTGAAPANADAPAGTARGNLVSIVTSASAQRVGFSVNAVVTGLTVGTAYWVDLLVAAITGGTASVKDISISIVEV